MYKIIKTYKASIFTYTVYVGDPLSLCKMIDSIARKEGFVVDGHPTTIEEVKIVGDKMELTTKWSGYAGD
jgi:hypothetical protein